MTERVLNENSSITREILVETICKIFGDCDTFLDKIEFEIINRFELFVSNGDSVGSGDVLLLDTFTGLFIKWYKLTHIGRDIDTNIKTKEELEKFLIELLMTY